MSIFGFKKKKGDEQNHWIAFAEGFSLSPSEFYAAFEKELARLQIPSMEVSRVDFAEGGMLSGKRVYLRMIRERLIFDACAAPFGTGFFFSCRSVFIPPVITLWHLVVVTLFLGGVFLAFVKLLGVVFAAVAVVTLVIAIALTFRNAIALGLSDVDATLIKTPVIGPIYECLFRKQTYFRADTRLMYLTTVPAIFQKLADDFTGAKGIKLERRYENAPILGELYKLVPPPAPPK